MSVPSHAVPPQGTPYRVCLPLLTILIFHKVLRDQEFLTSTMTSHPVTFAFLPPGVIPGRPPLPRVAPPPRLLLLLLLLLLL
jgi:hypothetical protein